MSLVKVVVIGDQEVGKSCLIVTHSTGSFPKDRVPLVLSILSDYVDESGETLTEILFYDTFGTADFDNGRHVLYRGTDVFLICFSLVDHSSLQNVLSKWYPELRECCPQTPVILIGLKLDLRQNAEINRIGSIASVVNGPIPVTYHEGLAAANSIGAVGYVECSAMTKSGLNDINKMLDTIIRGYVGISNRDTVRRRSSLGNWIVAVIFLVLVIVVLCSRYYWKN